MSDYAAVVCLVDIDVSTLQVTVSEFDFECVVNRSIFTKTHIYLIGAPLIIMNSNLSMIARLEPKDLGFKRTIKVGEVVDPYLYVSSHEGKLVKLSLPSLEFQKPLLKAIDEKIGRPKVEEIKGIYVDTFKIWRSMIGPILVASNNVKHTVTLYQLYSLRQLAIIPFVKLQQSLEFPYLNIYVDNEYCWFAITPEKVAIIYLTMVGIKRRDVDVGNSRKVIRINSTSALVDLYESKPDECDIENLCYTSKIVKKDNIFVRKRLELISSAFIDEGYIPLKYACKKLGGSNISPPLGWKNIPSGTKSLAILMDDPDAINKRGETITHTHWIIYDIDPKLTQLNEDMRQDVAMFDDGVKQGINDSGIVGYSGCCPPNTMIHHYRFHLFALDTMLIELNLNRDEFLQEIKDHVLESSLLEGLFQKPNVSFLEL